jgi:acyl-coenzyme A thioesterase 9
MEVGVCVEQGGEVTVHLASCYFTMVARSVDGGEQSLRLPPLQYVSEDEIRRSRRAQESRSLRKRSGEPEYPTTSEYAMLHDLHLAVDRSTRDLLLARDLVTSGWELTYPEHENVPKDLRGLRCAPRLYVRAYLRRNGSRSKGSADRE